MSINIDITPAEAQLLLNLLGQIHVKPTDANAVEVVTLVQSLMGKLVLEPAAE